MRFHWISTNLTVATMLVALLAAVPAYAFPCWACCPDGPMCSRDPDRIAYRSMIGHANYYTNTQITAKAPLTPAQMGDLAKRVRNWQIEADGNGDMSDLYLYIKVNATALKAAKFDSSKAVPALNSMKVNVNQAQFAKQFASLTQTVRTTFVNNVVSYGLDWVVTNTINELNYMALNPPEKLSPRLPDAWCRFGGDIAHNFGALGALSALLGNEPLAVTLLAVAAAADITTYYGDC